MPRLIDPFAQAPVEDHATPEFATPGNGQDCYFWQGVPYKRVTWYLSHAPGQHLLAYAAKTASLSACKPLIDAGLFVPPAQPTPGHLEYDAYDSLDQDALAYDETMAELERYIDSHAMRMVDPVEAIKHACDWKWHMRAQYRYRDHKGRIGHTAHFYKHDLALGLVGRPSIDHLAAIAHSKVTWDDDALMRFEQLGKSKEDVCLDLAHHALPYCELVFDWHERLMPEYISIGMEAMVLNRTVGYAGTLDETAVYDKARWQAAFEGKWPFDPSLRRAKLIADLKTSNHLGKMVRLQLGAYYGAETICVIADRSEHAMPEVDGAIALHARPGETMDCVPFGRGHLEQMREGFNSLVDFVQVLHNMKRVSRGRKDAPARKGERECPITVGVAS